MQNHGDQLLQNPAALFAEQTLVPVYPAENINERRRARERPPFCVCKSGKAAKNKPQQRKKAPGGGRRPQPGRHKTTLLCGRPRWRKLRPAPLPAVSARRRHAHFAAGGRWFWFPRAFRPAGFCL